MKSSHKLEFSCLSCLNRVFFDKEEEECICATCHRLYDFKANSVRNKIANFVNFCSSLQTAKDILPKIKIGVRVEKEEVVIPYNLLITHPILELQVNGDQLNIALSRE